MIRVSTEITAATADAFLAALRASDGPVTVQVDSPGGSVPAALRMAAAIEAREVHAVVRKADSCALALVAAARTRRYEAGATALVHGVKVSLSAATETTPSELTSVASEVAERERRFVALLARASGRSEDWWRTQQQREVVLDVSQLRALFPPNISATSSSSAQRVEAALVRCIERVDWGAALHRALVETGMAVPRSGRFDKRAHYIPPGLEWRRR